MEIKDKGLEYFFSGIESILKSAEKFQKANSLEYAFEFNPLIHFYGIGENRSSDILAFFLNPNEKHGQGNLFLSVFLSAEFGWKEKIVNFKTAKIYREKQTVRQRRIDLLIDIEFEDGKKHAIGIENKIWAADQENQILDYNNWLKKEYQDDYTLFYLTPFGKNPDVKSIPYKEFKILKDAKKILLIDHSSIMITLIDLWTEKCKADKVRQFLKDFKQYINHTINGNIFMTEKNTIADYVLASESKLKTAIAVRQSMEEVYNRLILSLEDPLNEMAEKRNIKLKFDLNRSEKCSGFSFEFAAEENKTFDIRFEWEATNVRYGFVGFVIKESNTKEINKVLKNTFSEIFGSYYSSEDWPWYKALEEYRNFNDETYLDIKSGNFLKFIEVKLDELVDAVKKVR